jgi:pyruvate-formate lyase-activating enzyme
MGDLDARQAAVTEKRQWVRLTRACNNHCLFCHDVGAHDGQVVPDDEVLARLQAGRADGASRAILSGGEPTIHPRFLDLVGAARDMGYTWIQCVSNGRMFAYDTFATRAMENGLNEATLSMHGHTAELFERLVGIPGSFRQSLRGLTNLLRLGAVVSVDVVLNRQNLPHLREILQFYIALGVMEFDLLHLVPFGRGFDEHRDTLFEDPVAVARELSRALSLVDEVPGLFLWTNRMPIELLEGHENLFQDPHKIYDEVLGERTAFKELFADGTDPECLGERCPWCFLRPFCDAARAAAAAGGAGPPGGGEATAATEADRAFCAAARGWTDAELRAAAANGLRMPLREDYREAVAAMPDRGDLQAMRARLDAPIDDLPPCLGGPLPGAVCFGALPFRTPDAPAGRPLTADDLPAFVSDFIRTGYRVKSLRCRACRHDGTCPGLHVHLARHWGLRALTPEN